MNILIVAGEKQHRDNFEKQFLAEKLFERGQTTGFIFETGKCPSNIKVLNADLVPLACAFVGEWPREERK
jgi:hypothetical protein